MCITLGQEAHLHPLGSLLREGVTELVEVLVALHRAQPEEKLAPEVFLQIT
jgi:hypothetical protein